MFLSISCHYAFVQMHLYLFIPPLLFLSLFPCLCYRPKKKEKKKRERVYAGPVLYKPVLFSGGVIKKKTTLNRTSLREEKGQILKSLFFLVSLFPCFHSFAFFSNLSCTLVHPSVKVSLKLCVRVQVAFTLLTQ